jgi:hypothetical protein
VSAVAGSPAASDIRYWITLPTLVEQAARAANGEFTYVAMKNVGDIPSTTVTELQHIWSEFDSRLVKFLCLPGRPDDPMVPPVSQKWSLGACSAEANMLLCEGDFFHRVPKSRMCGVLRLLSNTSL